MRKIIFLALLTAILTSGIAQLNPMKKMLGKKMPEKSTKKLPQSKKTKPAATKQTAIGKGKKFDFTSVPLRPAIEMASLLDFDKFTFTLDGVFKVNGHLVSFLPKTYTGGGEINYDEFREDKCKIFLKVQRENGSLVETFLYKAIPSNDIPGPFKRMFLYGKSPIETKLDIGKYNLEWSFSDGTVFYNYPFEVYTKTNNDPYAGNNSKMLFLKSPILENYAQFEYNKYKNLIFTFYYQNNSMEVVGSRIEARAIKYNIEMYKDGKLFAQQDNLHYASRGEKAVFRQENFPRGEWRPVSRSLFKEAISEKDKGGRNFGKDILKEDDLKDGKYLVKVEVDGKKMAYPFEVKDGKYIYLPEQNREIYPDQTRIIEGTNRYYWMRKK